jgi:hypothetical protein
VQSHLNTSFFFEPDFHVQVLVLVHLFVKSAKLESQWSFGSHFGAAVSAEALHRQALAFSPALQSGALVHREAIVACSESVSHQLLLASQTTSRHVQRAALSASPSVPVQSAGGAVVVHRVVEDSPALQ